ncbi:MAG: trypsin-like peptidase domain-containing protein [Deltaproteobacteria bacterium]|nr:trypsin-like peptidase domain-containing protein [Deltaproteobacteria bacterium]
MLLLPLVLAAGLGAAAKAAPPAPAQSPPPAPAMPAAGAGPTVPPTAEEIAAAVFRIEVFHSSDDLATPWRLGKPRSSTGTGFAIPGGRIFTNAHVVSGAKQVLIKRQGTAAPVPADVEFIAHDSDLALLKPHVASALDGVRPIELGALPKLRSQVVTYGFPLGGHELSSTAGIVSRIEFRHYAHTTLDDHLTVQTDAAINPGNSGGPVVQDGKAVGVAFQGIKDASNVGYFIPRPVIDRFLADMAPRRQCPRPGHRRRARPGRGLRRPPCRCAAARARAQGRLHRGVPLGRRARLRPGRRARHLLGWQDRQAGTGHRLARAQAVPRARHGQGHLPRLHAARLRVAAPVQPRAPRRARPGPPIRRARDECPPGRAGSRPARAG